MEGHGLKILIADDEIRMRRILSDYLQIKGYEPICAQDGAQAWELFQQRQPDLVLLDVMMPRLDGWEVCRRIRACSSVPVIMLTARGQEEDELHGFSLGADEYIAKPFSLKILLARVEAVLRRRGGGCSCGGTHCPGGIRPCSLLRCEHRPHGAGAPCGRPSGGAHLYRI